VLVCAYLQPLLHLTSITCVKYCHQKTTVFVAAHSENFVTLVCIIVIELQGVTTEAKAEAESKTLASKPLWPPGLNFSAHNLSNC